MKTELLQTGFQKNKSTELTDIMNEESNQNNQLSVDFGQMFDTLKVSRGFRKIRATDGYLDWLMVSKKVIDQIMYRILTEHELKFPQSSFLGLFFI